MTELLLKLVFPIIGVSFLSFFGMVFFGINALYAMMVLPLGLLVIGVYPVLRSERLKVNINENLHLFITYAGTLSTMKVSQGIIFRRIAQKKIFGELSKIAERVHYLGRSWNIGFATSCRKMAQLVPSRVFADFLDRLGIILDMGQELDVFFLDEQDSMMEDYSTTYKESLESIKMIQNLFVSLTVSAAFLMSVALLLPLVLGTSIDMVVKISLLVVIGIDVFIFVLVKAFIPNDRVPHLLPIRSNGMKRIKLYNIVVWPISILLLIILFLINKLPFLINFAIAATPLIAVGFVARSEEEKIKQRETLFPSYVRTLGSAIEVRSGAVISALMALRVHDFSHLNEMVVNLYRRLRLGSDKAVSWFYFAAETGSHVIFHFSKIFSESIYLGGNAEKIGEIVSKNATVLLGLRKLRMQLAGGLRGAFYGALLGFSASIYITAQISNALATMFSKPFSDAAEGNMGDLVTTLAPQLQQVDLITLSIYIGIMVIVHAMFSSLLLKIVDGGFKSAGLMDFSLMLWMGGIVSVVVPLLSKTILPSLGMIT